MPVGALSRRCSRHAGFGCRVSPPRRSWDVRSADPTAFGEDRICLHLTCAHVRQHLRCLSAHQVDVRTDESAKVSTTAALILYRDFTFPFGMVSGCRRSCPRTSSTQKVTFALEGIHMRESADIAWPHDSPRASASRPASDTGRSLPFSMNRAGAALWPWKPEPWGVAASA